jgi:fructose-bisphosphate aldolase class I
MFKETLGQAAADGRPFVQCLLEQGVLPGIKVDEVRGRTPARQAPSSARGPRTPTRQPANPSPQGLVPIEGHEGETSTRGLEALEASCRQYAEAGAKFAKWRAALRIGDGQPSELAVQTNAEQLAQYAATCQVRGRGLRRRARRRRGLRCGSAPGAGPAPQLHSAPGGCPQRRPSAGTAALHRPPPQSVGLVPIVEPEVLIDGGHSLQQFADVSERVISACVAQLWRRGVLLEGCLLKPQMMIQGAERPGPKPGSDEVAAATLRVMRRWAARAQGRGRQRPGPQVAVRGAARAEGPALARVQGSLALPRRWRARAPPCARARTHTRLARAAGLCPPPSRASCS